SALYMHIQGLSGQVQDLSMTTLENIYINSDAYRFSSWLSLDEFRVLEEFLVQLRDVREIDLFVGHLQKSFFPLFQGHIRRKFFFLHTAVALFW
ncbi:MAG: hypothetical protein PUP93_32845, partial [Rhizonema sp. NSF051]|nr:hypothetical protein [Rhizonema sp. NSF051]